MNRLFVIDFGCILPFGHNLKSNRIFASFYKKKYKTKEVLFIYPKSQKKENPSMIKKLPTCYWGLFIETEKFFLKRLFMKIFYQIANLTELFILLITFNQINFYIYRSQLVLKKIWKNQKINEEDVIIVPSADYYGLMALIKLMQSNFISKNQHILIRFIGVLENEKRFLKKNGIYDLINQINKINYPQIKISAESKKLAKFLNFFIDRYKVDVEFYPTISPNSKVNLIKKNNNKPIKILCPGTQRIDKGFFKIFKIAEALTLGLNYHFEIHIQDMRPWDRNYKKNYSQLLKLHPSIHLHSFFLDEDTRQTIYQQADIILLPYNAQAYLYRGSASVFEAVEFEKPILAESGCAFCDEIKGHKWGFVYENSNNLVDILNEKKKFS